jgi:hypothetical protein
MHRLPDTQIEIELKASRLAGDATEAVILSAP